MSDGVFLLQLDTHYRTICKDLAREFGPFATDSFLTFEAIGLAADMRNVNLPWSLVVAHTGYSSWTLGWGLNRYFPEICGERHAARYIYTEELISKILEIYTRTRSPRAVLKALKQTNPHLTLGIVSGIIHRNNSKARSK